MTVDTDRFIEIFPGLWYEVETGRPWSSVTKKGVPGRRSRTDGPMRPLKTRNRKGYYRVPVAGKARVWHRLVWEHFNGPIPEGLQIDHINNDPGDNRIENMTLVTLQENTQRGKMRKHKLGLRGIDEHTGGFRAAISVNGRSKYLGFFKTKQQAYLLYYAAKILFHGIESVRHLPKPC